MNRTAGSSVPAGIRVDTGETYAGDHRIYARRLLPVGAPRATVVVAHGMVVAGRGILPLAGALAARGLKVHLPDLPGFGRSGKPRRALDVAGQGAALAAWIRTVEPGPVVLIGNSFGTQVASAAAAGCAGLASVVVLIAPTIDARFRRGWATRLPAGRPGGPSRRGPVAEVQRRIVERLVPDQPAPAGPALGRLIVSEYIAAGPGRALSTYRHALRDDLLRSVRQIDAPLLVLRGETDRLVSPSWARAVAAAGGGGVLEIPGIDHDGQFHSPGVLADAVLAGLPTSATGPGVDGAAATQ